MFAIKIFNKREVGDGAFGKISGTIKQFIMEKLNKDVGIISDDNSVEIVSGGLARPSEDDEIVVELIIKRNVVINTSDFNDELELEKYLSEIKYFCEQAKNIEG